MKYLLLLCLLSSTNISYAQPLRIAVASNFAFSLKQLVQAYQSEHGGEFTISSASTGVLYQQIKRGAPFDVFFAADTERPNLLLQQGIAGDVKAYAQGQLVLYSAKNPISAVLSDTPRSCRVAIANPAFAPYGHAAKSALTHIPVLQRCQQVKASNVSQAFQFTAFKSVDVGFVAYSHIIEQQVAPEFYQLLNTDDSLTQSLAIIGAHESVSLSHFLAFLDSPRAQKMLVNLGYNSVLNYD